MTEIDRDSPCSRPAAIGVALLLTAFWFVLQGGGLAAIPFHSKGEPREAVVVQDILARGDWILPRRNGSEIVRKPPLFYWLGAATARATGRLDEGVVRLPSALQSWAACMLLVVLAAATGGALASLFAGVVLLSSFEWLRAATTARVDMTLALGTTATLVGVLLFDRRQRPIWLLVAYAGMAWGTLAKGPIAIALPALFAVLLALSRGAPFATLAHLRPVVGLLAVFCCVGLWYGLAAWRGGSTFVMTQIVEENLARFTGGARSLGGHEHSVLYLAGGLLAGLLPWTLVLPAALLHAWKMRAAHTHLLETSLLLWCATIFAFFAVAESKRSVYLLPMYPALALLLGRFLAAYSQGAAAGRATTVALRTVLCVLIALTALLALVFAAQAGGVPLVAAASDFVAAAARGRATVAIDALAARAAPLALFFAGAAAVAALAAWRLHGGRRAWALLGFAATCAVLMIATQRCILPAVATANTRRGETLARPRAGRVAASLAARPHYDYATAFYRGGIPVYAGPLSGGPPRLLIRRDEWRGLDWRSRALYQPVPGMDLAKQNNQVGYLLVERVAGSAADATARLAIDK